MVIANALHRYVDKLMNMPGIRHVEQSLYESVFRTKSDINLHRGVYASYSEAQAAIPTSKPVGYDNDGSAQLYKRRLFVVSSDYPALFWVWRSIDDGSRRFVDLGGSIGIKYYAFSRHREFPEDLHWHTIDVPAVAKMGAELAVKKNVAKRLGFSSDYADMDSCDVLFVSGAAQYLPEPLSELVEKLPNKPSRIIINTTPIHATRSYFTVNSIGTAFCPYRVEARDTFVGAFQSMGYHVRDMWENTGKGMRIPGHPDYDVKHYSGFCFDRG